MEGKTVILTVFLLSLVMAATATLWCPSDGTLRCYFICLNHDYDTDYCVNHCGCFTEFNGDIPKGYEKDTLQKTGSKEEYCKLGCVSSVCSVITTLQNSDAGEEVVNGAIEKCTKACSAFCTKGSITALETSA